MLDGDYEFDAITDLDGDLDNSNDLYSDFSGDTEQKTIFPLNNIAYIEPFNADFEEDFWQGDNTFDLDNDFVLSWIKSYIDTGLNESNGIYYKPAITTAKILGFQALTTTSSDAAKLKVVIEKQGNTLTKCPSRHYA